MKGKIIIIILILLLFSTNLCWVYKDAGKNLELTQKDLVIDSQYITIKQISKLALSKYQGRSIKDVLIELKELFPEFEPYFKGGNNGYVIVGFISFKINNQGNIEYIEPEIDS